MAKVFVGYIRWDIKRNKPAIGTRRFKVWTTERECMPVQREGYRVEKVFVEVPEDG